jgi:hypothetical protein
MLSDVIVSRTSALEKAVREMKVESSNLLGVGSGTVKIQTSLWKIGLTTAALFLLIWIFFSK